MQYAYLGFPTEYYKGVLATLTWLLESLRLMTTF